MEERILKKCIKRYEVCFNTINKSKMYLQFHISVGRMSVICQVSNTICFKTFRLNLYGL